MAIKLETQYPSRTTVDANNPNGTFKNSDPVGSLNGTPGDFAWAKDMWSFLEILMTSGSVTHSGSPDDANASQRYDALVKSARDVWPIWDSAHEYSGGVITVGSDDNPYYSLQATNTNHDPTSSPAWWRNFSFEALQTAARNVWPIWDSANTYPQGVGTIGSDGKPYYSLQAANINHDPISSPTWWQLLEYTSLRSDARNVWPIWDSANIYIKGAIVIASDEITYQSLQNSNINHDPTSSPAWWSQFVTNPASASQRGLVFVYDPGTMKNDVTDTVNDIEFSARTFTFDDLTGEARAPLYIKRLDALWSPGNNGGMLDAGVKTANTTYHCFAIYNPTSGLSDYLASLSASSPTLPGGYTKKRRVGSILTDGSLNNRLFLQTGKLFTLDNYVNDLFTTVFSATRQLQALTVPTGISVIALLNAALVKSSSPAALNHAIRFTNPNQTDQPPIQTTGTEIFDLSLSTGVNQGGAICTRLEITTDTSAQIGYRSTATASATDMELNTIGWRDYLLKR
jgi:hypothetical protein